MPDTLTWPPTVVLPEAVPPAFLAPEPTVHDALPTATRLDEFEIIRVLGAGGFGIVYLALDHVLLRYVAIKEYMPATFAGRGPGQTVSVRSPSHADTYAIGLESFFNEARMLASFDHPSLVKVHRFWKDNGTAYMAMQYYPGRTLREVRGEMRAPPEEAWLRACIEPLLGALELLHGEDIYHRDIAPDNILLLPDGRPVLLDFGSARRVISDRTQSLTAVLKPNFSPIEQYGDEPGMRQGPWTDIYALGATMYFMLTGLVPVPAVLRAVRDSLRAVSDPRTDDYPGISKVLLSTVDWTMALAPEDRPQSVATLRRSLGGECEVPPPAPRHTQLPPPTPAPLQPTSVPPSSDLPIDIPEAEPATVARPAAPAAMPAMAPPVPAPQRRGLAVACAALVLIAGAGIGAGKLLTATAAASSAPLTMTIVAASAPPATVVAAAPALAASVPAAVSTPVAVTEPMPAPPLAPASAPAGIALAALATAPIAAPVPPATAASKPAPRRAVARAPVEARVARLPANQTPAETSPKVAAQPENVVTAVAPKSAKELCGDMNSVALAMCVAWKCRSPALQADPQCVDIRRAEEQRRNRM